MLICKYLENPNSFDICKNLDIVVSVYNNTKHRTTLYKPIEVFYSKDEKLFEKIKFNTINNSKNYSIHISLFNINDYVLVFNNFKSKFIKNKNCYILEKSNIKKKHSLYDICDVIIGNDKGDYSVLIQKDYPINCLKKKDICITKYNLIKKVEYKVWIRILKK